MVAAQLEITDGQTLIRLRAYAVNNRSLTDVARDVVDSRVMLEQAKGVVAERLETS